jgi:hypothetical protein
LTFDVLIRKRVKTPIPARCFPFLALALMIFAWGTGYKLSLYKSVQPDGHAPAKLCTLASDAARSAVVEASNGQKAIPHSILVVSLSLPVTAVNAFSHVDIDDGQPANPSPFYPPKALDFRPPPQRHIDPA